MSGEEKVSSESGTEYGSVLRRTFLKTAGVAGVTTLSGTGASRPWRNPESHEREVLVGVSKSVADIGAVVADYLPTDAEIVHENETLSYVVVALAKDGEEAARTTFIETVVEDSHVRYAEKNGTYESLYTPDDPRFDDQYAPQMVNADAAWDETLGDSSVTIAVVDTGVQYDHPDLNGNFRSDPGYDFVDDDTDPYPDSLSDERHGTHVSGIAAAETDNGTGVAGISESTLVNARVLDESGVGTWSNVADGIQWAADQGADIINLSLGGGYSSTVEDAVSYAHNEGSLLVAAAGNDNEDVSSHYPASYPECIAVSALDPDGSFASYSNYGDEIELTAPGTSVLSTVPDDSYANFDGTSMATPVVSGTAGLAAAKWDLTNRDLRRHLKDTAVDIGLSSDKQGSGRVDADNAIATVPTLVVDDFEDGDFDEYSFDRGSSGASIVSSPTYNGTYALEYADTIVEAISTSDLSNYPRAGDTFRCRLQATGGGENANFTYGVQDHDNRYYVKVNFGDDSFRIFKFENASGTSLNGTSDLSLSVDTWYEIEIQWQTDGTHVARLYDPSGSKLAEVTGSDSTWLSGGVGFDAYLSDGETVYFDDVTLEPDQTNVLDAFEDGDIAEYSGNTDGYQVQSSTVLEGSYSLETTTTYAKIAHDTITTDRGYEYRCKTEAEGGSSAEPSLLACVQDTTYPMQSNYWAFPDASAGEFKLVRRDNGSSTVLDSLSYTLQEDTVYELALEVGTDTVKAVLYDSSGSVVVETARVSDTTYSGGRFGFYTGGGNPAYFDYVTKTPL